MASRIPSLRSLNIDRKYREPLEYTPVAKIVWAMNHKPRIANTQEGIFRRVKILEFPGISVSKRDPKVKEAIKREGAGLLNWALEGLARLLKRGHFEFPPEVVAATEEFEATNDIPALFVGEECITGAGLEESSGRLYERYKAWCQNNGHKERSSTAMADEWKRLGFEKLPLQNGRKFWGGVKLRQPGPR